MQQISASQSPLQAIPRFPTIDLLRGLSILAVILLHTWLRFSFASLEVAQGMPRWLGHLLFRNGGNGVTIFFAISGFLITFTSFQRFGPLAAMRPSIFYRIRFARIAPLLLLLLAILSLLHLLHVESYVINKPHASLPGALLSALTFTLNWYEAVHMHSWLPACWTVLWSLSIEEMFYLFFPIACLLLLRLRRGLPLFVTLLLALIVAGCFARTVWSRGDDLAQENSYLAGFGNIAVGILAALLARSFATRERTLAPKLLLGLQALGATLILLFAFYPRWHWVRPFMHFTAISGTDDALLALGTGLVMLASVLRSRPQPSGFADRLTAPLRWFGRHSYELYLAHEFLVLAGVALYLRYIHRNSALPLLLTTAAITLATAPLAWLLARFFSEPLNRRLRPHRKVTAPQVVQLSHT